MYIDMYPPCRKSGAHHNYLALNADSDYVHTATDSLLITASPMQRFKDAPKCKSAQHQHMLTVHTVNSQVDDATK